jgi:APA family basic amino acid/polyamine antiporter
MSQQPNRELGLFDVFCISSGAMISSGLFVLPAIAFSIAGPGIILSYLLAAIVLIPAVLSKAELVTTMPKAGGMYSYLERALGPATGTFSGLASWFALSLKSAFALLGMAIFVMLMYPHSSEIYMKIVAVILCILFTAVNIIGVKVTGRLHKSLVIFVFVLLCAYALRGIHFISLQRYAPFMPFGIESAFVTAGLIFVSYGGLTEIAVLAENVKNPHRTIPAGMILALAVTTLLYVAVVAVTVGLVAGVELRHTVVPTVLGAAHAMGIVGMVLMVLAGLVAFITTANVGIFCASRFPMAMSGDQLLPPLFQRVNFRFRTPHVSILITGSMMILAVLFLTLEDLVKTASTFMIILFMSMNIAVIIMRESRIPSYRPTLHAPLYPWLQVSGIAVSGFLIFKMGRVPLSITGIFLAASLTWYLIYARFRVSRQSALVHVVERITNRKLAAATLHGELKQILIKRDNIVEDRFDHLIRNCVILDIDHSVSAEDAFKRLAEILSPRLELDQEILFSLFLQRETQSSTIIAPGLAIPHVLVEGKKKFDILVVRCKEGITFPETSEPVHTMFVLVGSMDERNFHLASLAAIAQIAQDKLFEKYWLKAQSTEDLRDILFVAERKRIGAV